MGDNYDEFESDVESKHSDDIDTHGLLPPPSDGTYTIWEEAYNLCQDWARTHGYCLRIKSSSKLRDKITVRQKVLVCDLEGEYECKGQIRKHRISKKKGCDFKLTIDRKAGSYYIKIHNPQHKNHEVSWSAFKHIIHRRRDEPSRNLSRAQIIADVPPKDILTGLRQATGSTNITLKDIYNEKRTWRQWQLNGDTPIEALLRILQDKKKGVFSYKTDENSRVTHLFFAFREAVETFQSNPDILMADCTYRTNRFRLPLLHFLGVCGTNKHFSAAYCVMNDELEPSYDWALEQFHVYLVSPVNR